MNVHTNTKRWRAKRRITEKQKKKGFTSETVHSFSMQIYAILSTWVFEKQKKNENKKEKKK